MQSTEVSHDPFGRFCIMRKVEHNANCAWCGNERAKGGAFRYGIRNDDSLIGWINWQRETFCCIQCMRAFHA